jgi:hypothetical protein
MQSAERMLSRAWLDATNLRHREVTSVVSPLTSQRGVTPLSQVPNEGRWRERH